MHHGVPLDKHTRSLVKGKQRTQKTEQNAGRENNYALFLRSTAYKGNWNANAALS